MWDFISFFLKKAVSFCLVCSAPYTVSFMCVLKHERTWVVFRWTWKIAPSTLKHFSVVCLGSKGGWTLSSLSLPFTHPDSELRHGTVRENTCTVSVPATVSHRGEGWGGHAADERAERTTTLSTHLTCWESESTTISSKIKPQSASVLLEPTANSDADREKEPFC